MNIDTTAADRIRYAGPKNWAKIAQTFEYPHDILMRCFWLGEDREETQLIWLI